MEHLVNWHRNPNYFTEMSAASFADLGYTIRTDYAVVADPGYVFV